MDVLHKHYTQAFQRLSDNHCLRSCIAASWAIFDKYYQLTDESPAYGAAMILHPSRRMAHIRKNWPKSWHKPVLDGVKKYWEDHYQGLPITTTTPELRDSLQPLDEYDLLARELDVVSPAMCDLDEYKAFIAETPVAIDCSPLAWWLREEQQQRYPRLSRMAVDILSIPAMSAEPERIFSGARRTISWDRCRLGSRTIERGECMKSWIKSGITQGIPVDLAEEGGNEEAGADLRGQLKQNIEQLYEKLLLYQMRSIRLYYRNWAIGIGRDLLKIDDWAGQLSDIQDAESAVQRDMEQYNTEESKTRLRELSDTANTMQKSLQGINSAIQDQAEQQDNWRKDDKYEQIMKYLRETDPRDDKTRIQDAKGGLLRDTYRWILEHDHFQKWRNDPRSQLLWIKGDPGKGKTMLLCGIIDELEKESEQCLSYFFCQATDARLSNATAALRGLIYLLVARKPSLISHVREKYDHAGKQAFEDGNAWEAMSKTLTSIINDPSLDGATLVIDALDECKTNRHQLLGFLVRPSRVKWVVSGRNWQDIEERLGSTEHKIWLQLELNQNSISKAVDNYINFKVDELAGLKKYDILTKDTVKRHLSANADGTFLWVALACKELADPMITRNRHTLSQLKKFPSGLGPLYTQMMKQISESRDAKLCKEILAIASVVYRPITLEELKVFVESMENRTTTMTCPKSSRHSAKDFLLENASDQLLPSSATHQHRAIFSKSLEALFQTLERDICKLGAPGFPIDQLSPERLETLASIRYCCVFWVDHLHDSDSITIRTALRNNGDIHRFIRDKYLYWLECLSLLGSIAEGIKAVHKLEALVEKHEMQHLTELVRDARRFVLSHKTPIEIAPLQAYASALLFSPERSLVRELFRYEEPDWIVSKPRMEADWNACLQTLEGHSNSVTSVVFSADGRYLASGSNDKTVKIWDLTTGRCLQSLSIGRADAQRARGLSGITLGASQQTCPGNGNESTA
ncbi:hypothetical protein S40288_09580 [Stachybotrys chartarum IBT 40288]|nr:hypothetical protein S40288_09580 [Stachybotrys chartarum IBT 40288]